MEQQEDGHAWLSYALWTFLSFIFYLNQTLDYSVAGALLAAIATQINRPRNTYLKTAQSVYFS